MDHKQYIWANSLFMITLNIPGLRRSMALISLGLLISWISPASAQNNKPVQAAAAGSLKYGKYGCTASKYSNGSYEFIPRGSFTISKNGKYTYYGLEKPSSGTFTIDNQGNLLFKGGYLNGGKAEKIDRPNKFFLVFPTIPDNRWTCTLINE